MWLLSVFLHLTKHEFYITGCLNDSSSQQSKFECLNMYTSNIIKLTKVSWNTPPIINYKSIMNTLTVQNPRHKCDLGNNMRMIYSYREVLLGRNPPNGVVLTMKSTERQTLSFRETWPQLDSNHWSFDQEAQAPTTKPLSHAAPPPPSPPKKRK